MFRSEVEHLTPDHPGPACGAGKQQCHVGPDGPIWMRGRGGHELERDSQKRVAGEDRRRLVERLVDRRHAAPEVVVVHRRQIVVDERIGVQAFHRRGGDLRVAGLRAEERRAFRHQERPEPLAARQERVPHRGGKPLRHGKADADRRGGEERFEPRLDPAGRG